MAKTATTVATICGQSILDLGRQLAAAKAVYDAHDDVVACRDIPDSESARKVTTERACKHAQALFFDRVDALETLITTAPAQNLADAAVQIAIAAGLAGRLVANENSEYEVEDKAEKIERMMLGMLPIIAGAAGLDLVAMGWDEFDGLRASRFSAVEVTL